MRQIMVQKACYIQKSQHRRIIKVSKQQFKQIFTSHPCHSLLKSPIDHLWILSTLMLMAEVLGLLFTEQLIRV